MKVVQPNDPEWGKKRRLNSQALAKEKANERQWELVRLAIDAWVRAFPIEWFHFQQDLIQGRNEYNEAKEGQLKNAQFRNTAAFPVAYRLNEDGSVREEALLPVLKKIIPGLTDKHSVNFSEFVRRFPAFRPSEKSNTSSFSTPFSGYQQKVEPEKRKRKKKV